MMTETIGFRSAHGKQGQGRQVGEKATEEEPKGKARGQEAEKGEVTSPYLTKTGDEADEP
jgi:hypothetical protein